MYLALYRKWRPRTFDDVVSQEHITATLQNQVKTGKIAHAYLFTGSRGTGKTTCAKILSAAVNCHNPQNGNPCLCCDSCKSILDGTNLDVQEIDAASNNGVDNIRQLREEAFFLPSQSKYRVYIIDETHMLSPAAFNALLKIMEEPPEHVIFILATTEVQKVPATILSRCQRFDFNRIRLQDIITRLKYIASQEQFTITDEAASMIARLADGAMRDALSLTDQCIAYSQDITEETVINATGVTGRDYLFEICDCILANDTAKALQILGMLYDRSKDLQNFCEELAGQLRDIMILKAGNGAVELKFILPAELQRMKQYAESFSLARLLRYLQILQETLDAMSKYADKRLNMEMCLIRICNPSADHAPQGLLQRIEALEQALQRGAWIAAPAGQTSVSKPTPSEQMPSPEAPASPQAQKSEPASSFSPPVVTEPAKDSSLKPETASESTDSAAQSVSEASAAPSAESAETSAPNPSTESAASNQASATLQPFAAWNTVLDQLKAADPFIYGLVFNAIVYEKGPYLYMKSPMGSLVSSLKKDNGSSRLLAVVKQVTGNTYKLRLAKDSNSTQAKAPAVDPLLELAERARLAGVDIVEN